MRFFFSFWKVLCGLAWCFLASRFVHMIPLGLISDFRSQFKKLIIQTVLRTRLMELLGRKETNSLLGLVQPFDFKRKWRLETGLSFFSDIVSVFFLL